MTKEKKTVNVVNEKGVSMLCMSEIGREGNHMTVVGSLIGAWESTMYVSPEEIVKMIGLVLNRKVIGYILTLPFILRRYRKSLKDND